MRFSLFAVPSFAYHLPDDPPPSPQSSNCNMDVDSISDLPTPQKQFSRSQADSIPPPPSAERDVFHLLQTRRDALAKAAGTLSDPAPKFGHPVFDHSGPREYPPALPHPPVCGLADYAAGRRPSSIPLPRASAAQRPRPPPIPRAPVAQRPPPGRPSTAILLTNAKLERAVDIKMEKTKAISNIFHSLKGKCYVCWAWTGRLRPNDHPPFTPECSPVPVDEVTHYRGWIDMKKDLTKRFPKYQYCHPCGASQKYPPQGHPEFKTREKIFCPFSDFTYQIMWHVLHIPSVWSAARHDFVDLPVVPMSRADFITWCLRVRDIDCYYNGLELFLWFVNNHSNLIIPYKQ